MAGPTHERGGPDPHEDDVAAQWADLTARLGELRLPPAPDGEDEAPAPRAPRTPPAPGPRDFTVREPGRGDDEDDDPARDLVDGFRPPDPEPLAGAHPVVALGWTAVLASLVVMVLCAVVWQGAPGIVWVVAALALVGGAGLLLWQMPGRRDADDHDDGAVV